jgi:serine/threonine-protein kinase
MAPELIEEQRPDARSDIYSLGGVACFLLTGRPPFERETLAELYSAHVHAELPRLREQIPELPSDLESVLLRCLAKEPSARYQDAVELAAALATTRCSAEWSSAQAETWWQAHAAASTTEDRAEEGQIAEGSGVEPQATGARNG